MFCENCGKKVDNNRLCCTSCKTKATLAQYSAIKIELNAEKPETYKSNRSERVVPADKKTPHTKIFALVAGIVLLVVGIAAMSSVFMDKTPVDKEKITKKKSTLIMDTVYLDGSSIDIVVNNQTDAYEALETVADEFGCEGKTSDFEVEKRKDIFYEDIYYRFTQKESKSSPYVKVIIMSVDENGKVFSVCGRDCKVRNAEQIVLEDTSVTEQTPEQEKETELSEVTESTSGIYETTKGKKHGDEPEIENDAPELSDDEPDDVEDVPVSVADETEECEAAKREIEKYINGIVIFNSEKDLLASYSLVINCFDIGSFDGTEKERILDSLVDTAANISVDEDIIKTENDMAIMAQLWRKSVYMLTPQSDYSDCRMAIEISAKRLVAKKIIDEEQLAGIIRAFDDARILQKDIINK